MKRILIITLIVIACLCGLYTYLTWGIGGNPRFMHHRYNKVITEPLAKIGFSDAQYKMGLFYIVGAIDPPSDEYNAKADLEKATYWFEKASAQGNYEATRELMKVREKVRLDSLSAHGMAEDVIIHLNTDERYNAIIQTLYDKDRNEYYFITSIQKGGKWLEVDAQVHSLVDEYNAPSRSKRNKKFILELQARATHVASIDGDLYLLKMKHNRPKKK